MDDLGGILAGNYGFRPQGKSAPMSASKPSSTTASAAPNRSGSTWSSADSWLEDRSPPAHDDLLGGSASFSNRGRSPATVDSILDGFENLGTNSSSSAASMPVFDKPLYDEDDDMFDGVPGMRSSSSASAPFDVFESVSTGSNRAKSPPPFDDLLENLGRGVPQQSKDVGGKGSGERKKQNASDFDDLIPGFGGSSPSKRRESPEVNQPRFTAPSPQTAANMAGDPFIVLESASSSGTSTSGLQTDPLEHISRTMNSGSTRVDSSPVNGVFDETDSFAELQNSMSSLNNGINKNTRDKSPSPDTQKIDSAYQFSGKEPFHQSSDVFDDILPKKQPSKPKSEKGSRKNDFYGSEMFGGNAMGDQSPKFNEQFETTNDVWLTVSEIPLTTQPTTAPPPSRKPPPLVIKQGSFGANARPKDNGSFSQSTQSYNAKDSMQRSFVSPIDELENFANGKHQMHKQNSSLNEEEFEANLAAAAAMKEAMDRAEAKFKHAKEFREREAKSKEYTNQEQDEKAKVDENDFEDQESQEKLDREREEREKEQKGLQRERELQLERERARQAVERATREARERAAAEARQKAERAAAEKAAAEARQRAERAAVQRAAAEARERAAAEARERAAAEAREKAARERASAEARERAEREKSERASVEKAAAEARLRAERAAVERAAAEARERAAAASRERQQKPDDDLESFFGMGARPTSAPKSRSTTVDSMFGGQTQNKSSTDGPRRTSSTASSSMKKASSATNIVDDLSSIFGGPPSSGEFQEIEGETEERRRARLERHQRTLERAAKALAEKNERDMQTQREQAERHRISETLDFEIKRWAAGKEGNLRALLSTLQYVLWPECGWQPVSLTDLITGAAVKKVYRKATLCIHPDKVQQKGATLQQKYIAEKVFDLLKEAWNKFNSEELF